LLGIGQPEFKRTGNFVVEDAGRGIWIRRSGGDVQGGDFHNEQGVRINWPVEYRTDEIHFDVPVYSRDVSYLVELAGERVERSYRAAYALPVDILAKYFSINYRRRYGDEPTEADVLTFVRDIGSALECMSEPNLDDAKQHLGDQVNFQIIPFDTFGIGAVPIQIDWNRVGKAAIAVLAASERRAPPLSKREGALRPQTTRCGHDHRSIAWLHGVGMVEDVDR
jgi:hypothetical protein